MNDLKRLNGDVSKILKEYSTNSQKEGSIVDQIDYIQQSMGKLKENESPAKDLTEVVKQILDELDGDKEQEIIDFINKVKKNKFGEAQDRYDKLAYDLSEFEKRHREVNQENEGFISTLNKANNKAKSKEKGKLIDQLLRESNGSQKDLKKIRSDAGMFTP